MTTCPKCQQTSGNSWSQCDGECPMPMSPHFRPAGEMHPARTTHFTLGRKVRHKTSGGSYTVEGLSTGAGVCRPEQRVVYRCIVTGKLYHRTTYDFVKQMEFVE